MSDTRERCVENKIVQDRLTDQRQEEPWVPLVGLVKNAKKDQRSFGPT